MQRPIVVPVEVARYFESFDEEVRKAIAIAMCVGVDSTMDVFSELKKHERLPTLYAVELMERLIPLIHADYYPIGNLGVHGEVDE